MQFASAAARTRVPHPHAEIQRKIDEEIIHLEARIVSLKSTRNQFAPVSRLYPEILQEIFFLAHYSSSLKGKTSLVITWVCRQWRELAQNTTILWSRIDFTDTEWMEAALSRTKRRQLEFDFDHFGQGLDFQPILTADFIQYCLRHLPRIRMLKLRCLDDPSAWFRENVQQWQQPAPVLRDLSFHGVALPSNLFSENFPSLQTLHLSSCAFDWDTFPVIPGLRELVIHEPETRASFDRVMEILEEVKGNLEKLSFQQVIETLDHDLDLELLEYTHFGSLKLLKVDEDRPELVLSLLNYILLPPQSTIELRISEWTAEYTDELGTALVDVRQMEKWPVDTLQISVDDKSLTLCFLENIGEDGVPGSRIRLELLASEFPDDSVYLIDLLPIHPVRKIMFMVHKIQLENEDAFYRISHLGAVEELTIKLQALGSFLDVIEGNMDTLERVVGRDYVDDDSKRRELQKYLFFSTVKKLVIGGNVGGNAQDKSGHGGYQLNRDDFKLLKKWAKLRKAHGLGLQRLVFVDLVVPDLRWVTNLFKGTADKFRMRGVTEG